MSIQHENNLTDLRVKKTRKIIFQALVTLLNGKPFEKITISEICVTAMVHRSTFYQHYEDKNHLLASGLYDLIVLIASPIKPENQGSLEEKTLPVFVHIAEMKKFYQLLSNDSENTSLGASFREQIAIDIRSKMNQIEYSNCKELELSASFFSGAIYSFIREWVKNDCSPSPEITAHLICSLFSGDYFRKALITKQ